MKKTQASFKSEKQLSICFKKIFIDKIKEENILYYSEFKGMFGVPDYLVIERSNKSIMHIIAFELKLKNWRQALKQAFRYRTFSNLSFVILDEKYVELALNHIDEFIKFNVGLASINKNNGIKVFHLPKRKAPFSISYVMNLENKIINASDLVKDIPNQIMTNKIPLSYKNMISRFIIIRNKNTNIVTKKDTYLYNILSAKKTSMPNVIFKSKVRIS